MGSLGPIQLLCLLLAVAVTPATSGFVASTMRRRNKRRARGFFVVGFLSGLMAGAIVRRTRGGSGRFAVRALSRAASHARPGLSPQWHRQLRVLGR
jgi:hypothetical protein